MNQNFLKRVGRTFIRQLGKVNIDWIFDDIKELLLNFRRHDIDIVDFFSKEFYLSERHE